MVVPDTDARCSLLCAVLLWYCCCLLSVRCKADGGKQATICVSAGTPSTAAVHSSSSGVHLCLVDCVLLHSFNSSSTQQQQWCTSVSGTDTRSLCITALLLLLLLLLLPVRCSLSKC